ncbi:MAG: SagB/ThcOx family dehydrogenase [Desulfobulbaceae bacterium]
MKISLPPPIIDGSVSLEQCLYTRRCQRKFSDSPLTLPEISQLAWAALGITSRKGYRTCPSAGALYPLELLVLAANVQDLAAGLYRYAVKPHELHLINPGDLRHALADAGLGQSAIREAPACLVFTAFYERTTGKYGQRGVQYVHMEAGHAAQNVCLQIAALGLATVMIGAFHDDRVKKNLSLVQDENPLYILPVGRARIA